MDRLKSKGVDRLNNKRIWIDSRHHWRSTLYMGCQKWLCLCASIFPLISDSLGSVTHFMAQSIFEKRGLVINEILVLLLEVSSSLTDYFWQTCMSLGFIFFKKPHNCRPKKIEGVFWSIASASAEQLSHYE